MEADDEGADSFDSDFRLQRLRGWIEKERKKTDNPREDGLIGP